MKEFNIILVRRFSERFSPPVDMYLNFEIRNLKNIFPPVDLHWFFEISISAFISNWDKNSVIN